MPCDRGTVKLEGVMVDVLCDGMNETVRKNCLFEDNPAEVHLLIGTDFEEMIKNSTADIIVLTDSQSKYLYGHLARLVKHFADPNVNVVCGNRRDAPLFTELSTWFGARPLLPGAIAFRRPEYVKYGSVEAIPGKYVFEPKAVVL